jgi:hypothetical protein
MGGTAREYSGPKGSADRSAGQQFGPPQASRTGCLCTEATIAVPVPTASVSNPKITTVIFIVPPWAFATNTSTLSVDKPAANH